MSDIPARTWTGLELANGRYRVDTVLGEGGMGAVYRARDKNLNTDVVVKVPHASLLQDAEFAARFAREISSLVQLSHPHIVKISDVGQHDGLPFAVMQFLPGGSLEEQQKSGPDGVVEPMLADSLKSWLPSIAAALDFVHSQGYIHRDVKPANILFDAHGHAYLSDFGIAKSAVSGPSVAANKTLTGSGMVIGTPEYMAPELIMGQSCDGRVDQYALAVTVFEILAGRRPFEDATSTAVLVQHSMKEPPDLAAINPDVSAGLASVIRKGLSKSPSDRFANCRKFADAVLGAVTAMSTSDERKATCPVCQKVLRLSEKVRGKDVPCPSCKTTLRVSDDLRQLSAFKSGDDPAGGTGTRIVSARGATPVAVEESDGTYRLAAEYPEVAVAHQPQQPAASASATQETMALGQPSSRTKPIQSPASAKKAQPEKPQSRAAKPRVPEKKPPVANKKWLSIAASSAAIVLLLGITIFVMTGRGTVKIAIKDGDDSVQVKVDGDEIAITGLDEPLKLNVGEHSLTVTSPRFETVTKSFKVKRGDTTVVEVELLPTPTSAPAEPPVAKAETPEPVVTDKPAIYSVELDPPQAAFSVEGDGVTVAGTGPQRTVSVAKPQPDKPVVLVARLDGFQEARRKLQPAPGASEAIVLKLSPPAKPVPTTSVASSTVPVAAFKIQLDSDPAIYQRTTLKLGGSLIGVPDTLQNSLMADVDFGDSGAVEPVDLTPDLTFQLEHVYPTPGEFPVTVVVTDSKTDPVKATATVTVKALTPVPDAAALDKSRKTIRDLFKKEFADANKTAARIAWSEKLIEQAQQTADDPTGRYVLFEEAALQAVEAPEPSLVFRAIDEMAKTFDINPHAKKAEFLALTVQKTKFATYQKKSAEAGLAAFEDALHNDEFDAASVFLKAAQKAAEVGKEIAFVKKVTTAFEKLAARKKTWDQFIEARKVLETSIDDPAANQGMGSYLCFVRGQWNPGLPLLAKGPAGREAELAALDLKRSKTDQEQLSVADGWKTLADGADAVYQSQLQRRAVYWYRRVAPQLTGLSRQRVDDALTQLGGTIDHIPKAILQINKQLPGLHENAVVACNRQITLVVWQGKLPGKPDWDIYGCVVDSNGTVGVPFMVNQHQPEDQWRPSVAVSGNGSFAVAWESIQQDGSESGIFARPVSPIGLPSGREFQVNSFTANHQSAPRVTASLDGRVLVVWASLDQIEKWDVFGKVFSENGTKNGSEFRVNDDVAFNQHTPFAVFSAKDSLLVSFEREKGTAAGYDIVAQKLDRTGARIGAEFRVNAAAHGPFGYGKGTSKIATNGNNRLVVVWHDFHPTQPQDGSDYGVFAQVFDFNGNRINNELRVNETTKDFQGEHAVSMLPNGEFLVVWHGNGNGDPKGVFGRLFSPDGRPLSAEIRINDFPDGVQARPDVSGTSKGTHFVVTWTGDGPEGAKGVFAKWLIPASLQSSKNVPK